jgi:Fe-S-cluster containining protein
LALVIEELPPQPPVHPCLRCGACCAHYRTSFYWAEADDATPGGVPVALTEVISPHLRAMRGTTQARPRCVALSGDIGTAVRCDIHPQRPSACRDYTPSYENGVANPRCDAARAAHGLAALTPDDWPDSARSSVTLAVNPGMLPDDRAIPALTLVAASDRALPVATLQVVDATAEDRSRVPGWTQATLSADPASFAGLPTELTHPHPVVADPTPLADQALPRLADTGAADLPRPADDAVPG